MGPCPMAGVRDSVTPARPNRSNHGRRPGPVSSWSDRQSDGDVNEPDRGDRSHCGPDYLTIGCSRCCSDLSLTSRRAVRLDLGYQFLQPLVVPPQRKFSKEVCNLWPRRKSRPRLPASFLVGLFLIVIQPNLRSQLGRMGWYRPLFRLSVPPSE